MVQLSAITGLIRGLNELLDSGKHDDITIDEVKTHIEDGSILRFLKDRTDDDLDLTMYLDPSAYGRSLERYYVGALQSILGGYAGDERRRWGVQNKGVCLLLALTNQIIQDGDGWKPNENYAKL